MIEYPFVGVYTRSVAPTLEPVSLEEAKEHTRQIDGADDEMLARLIQVARSQFEASVGRQVCRATWQLKLDDWPSSGTAIELPYPPLVSVSSIAYLDSDGDSQTLASSVYDVSTVWEPGRIRLAYGQSWPSHRDVAEAITITYLAGYDDRDDVPAHWKQAILMILSTLYENDAGEVIGQGFTPVQVKAYQSLIQTSRWC